MPLTFVGDGRIAVRVAGDPARPAIVLVHGWGQSGAVWSAQSALADEFFLIAPDLRGHGESAAPDAGYDDPAAWADDLAAVLALATGPAVLVGWSYGGLVVTDYVRERGCADLSGIVFAGALTEIGRDRPGGVIGPAMRAALPDALSVDPEVATPAVARFAAAMTASPAPGDDVQRRTAATLAVSPRVRRAMFRRDVGSADVLAGIDVPVRVVHGTADTVVDRASAEHALALAPDATAHWFDGVGHMPFAERAAEFNSVLSVTADGG